jgi:hypothetical protein
MYGLGQGAGSTIVVPAVSSVGGALTPAVAGWLGLAVPVVGGIVAGVALGLTAIFNRRGPKQKEAAARAADEVEALLKQNVAGYLAGSRSLQERAAALANFDAAWAWLISADGCGNPALGSPGERCISERARGGAAPWCPTVTGCDWFALYRDPISRDDVPASRGIDVDIKSPWANWFDGGAGSSGSAPSAGVPAGLLVGLALLGVGVALS